MNSFRSNPAETETKSAGYACEMCSTVFGSQHDFVAHYRKRRNSQINCCNCNASFASITELFEHHQNHDEVFAPTVIYLNKQEGIAALENKFSCFHDHTYAYTRAFLLKEKRRLLEEKKMLDDIDRNERYSSSGNTPVVAFLPAEFAQEPSDEIEDPLGPAALGYIILNPTVDDSERTQYKCLNCEQLFLNKLAFFRHIAKDKCFVRNCDVCFEVFVKNSDFYEHYVSKHSSRGVCRLCFRTFVHDRNVKSHMQRHLDLFNFRCDQCSKGFYTAREYKSHHSNKHAN